MHVPFENVLIVIVKVENVVEEVRLCLITKWGLSHSWVLFIVESIVNTVVDEPKNTVVGSLHPVQVTHFEL